MALDPAALPPRELYALMVSLIIPRPIAWTGTRGRDGRDNLAPFLAAVPGVLEVSIGHALIGDALEFGLEDTVRRYLRCIGP